MFKRLFGLSLKKNEAEAPPTELPNNETDDVGYEIFNVYQRKVKDHYLTPGSHRRYGSSHSSSSEDTPSTTKELVKKYPSKEPLLLDREFIKNLDKAVIYSLTCSSHRDLEKLKKAVTTLPSYSRIKLDIILPIASYGRARKYIDHVWVNGIFLQNK